jgi:hypothetical protein
MKEKFIDTVKKLLAKAEQASTQEEAQTFFAKASELMQKHAIEEHELEDEEEKVSRDPNVVFIYTNPLYGYWEVDLVGVFATYNWCRAIFTGVNNAKYIKPYATLIGKPSNIECVKYMLEVAQRKFPQFASESYAEKVKEFREEFKVVVNSKEKALEEFRNRYLHKVNLSMRSMDFAELLRFTHKITSLNQSVAKLTPDDFMPASYKESNKDKNQYWYLKNVNKLPELISDRGVYIRSYLAGVIHGIKVKYKDQYAYTQEQYSSEGKGDELILIRKQNDKEIEECITKEFPRLTTLGKTTVTADRDALTEGVKKGYTEGINRGINTSGGKASTLIG